MRWPVLVLVLVLVLALVAAACRREIVSFGPSQPAYGEGPADASAGDSAPDPDELPPIVVQVEVKGRVVDAQPDPVTKQMVATALVGANQGVQEGWVGEVIDDTGAHVGDFTIRAIGPRTTTGTTTLTRDQLAGKLVRLTSP
jgi:hypothetical protein